MMFRANKHTEPLPLLPSYYLLLLTYLYNTKNWSKKNIEAIFLLLHGIEFALPSRPRRERCVFTPSNMAVAYQN